MTTMITSTTGTKEAREAREAREAKLLQKRFLKQQTLLLYYTLVTGAMLFIGMACSLLLPSTSTVHRYQLAIFLAFSVNLIALLCLLFTVMTASFYKPLVLMQVRPVYHILAAPLALCLLVSGGLICWMLWELARVYQDSFHNPLFSQYLAFIPIGGFTLLMIWLAALWTYPAKDSETDTLSS
jgi:hypothetical protein